MALNTVEDRVVLAFEDDVTAPVKQTSAAYDRELKSMEKSTKESSNSLKDFGSSAKALKSNLSAFFIGSFGGYALAMGLLGDAATYAATTLKGFMMGVKFDEKALSDLNEYVTGLQNAGKAQSYLIGLKIADLEAQIRINAAQNATASVGSKMFTSNIYGALASFGAWLGMKKEEGKVIEDNSKKMKTANDLLKDLKDLQDKALAKESFETRKKQIEDYTKLVKELAREIKLLPSAMSGISVSESDRFRAGAMNTGAMKDARAFQFTQSNLLLKEAANAEKAAASQRQLAEARFQADQSLANAIPLMDLVPSKFEQMRIAVTAVMQATSAGFAAMGAAMVNGANGFKNFGKVFLGMLGQLAIQFGSFLIAVGVGMSAVPEIFGFHKGAAAIAAGIALTVLGGALTALSGKGKTSSSGGGGDYSPSQDYGNRDYGERQGSTNVTVLIQQGAMQLLDSSQLTDKRMRELAYNFGMSFSDQRMNKDRGNY